MPEVENLVAGFQNWLEGERLNGHLNRRGTVDSLLSDYLITVGIKDINQYVGDIKALRNGKVYQELTSELTKLGVKPKVGEPANRQVDLLERYRSVPLHAIFLYTSEDKEVVSYISDNWGALDSLSGEFCDVHQSVDQFRNKEDAYDFIEKLQVIRDSNFKEYSQLPGLFFWDNSGATAYLSFGGKTNEERVRSVVRLAFEEIRKEPVISSIERAKKRLNTKSGAMTKKKLQKKRSIWGDLSAFLLAFLIILPRLL